MTDGTFGPWETDRAAKAAAAFASLRRLYASASEPRRRVVLELELPDALVERTPRLDAPTHVRITRPPDGSAVVAVHVDEPGVEADVALAAEAVPACDLGGMDEANVAAATQHSLVRHTRQQILDRPRDRTS